MNKNQQQQERKRMDSKEFFFPQVSRHTHLNTEILISTWMVKLINIEIILGKEKKEVDCSVEFALFVGILETEY